jgi:hypothetical protein
MTTPDLFDDIPKPTGTIRTWWIDDYDVFEEIRKLLGAIHQNTLWNYADEVYRLREILTGLPGFPKMDPGDKIEVRLRQKPTILIPRTYSARIP